MEKMTVRYCFDVELSVKHDPRDIGLDIYERINTMPMGRIIDTRYSVLSGRQVNEDTGVTAPRKGTIPTED